MVGMIQKLSDKYPIAPENPVPPVAEMVTKLDELTDAVNALIWASLTEEQKQRILNQKRG